MKERLTDKQLAAICFMREFLKENDQMPPPAMVSAHLRTKASEASEASSRINGHYHYNTLAAKGYLERNAAGGYRFKREAHAE